MCARLPRMAVDGDTIWTEWDMSGTRRDGAAFLMRGVAIFGVAEGRLAWVRFYLEPVEETSGDVNAPPRWRALPRSAPAFRGKVMILVARGTGTLGTQIVPLLSARDGGVRVLTRGLAPPASTSPASRARRATSPSRPAPRPGSKPSSRSTFVALDWKGDRLVGAACTKTSSTNRDH